METKSRKLLLVGDNPFHGISHLSEDRARDRDKKLTNAEYAAGLVLTSLKNGADGFMFSVSETTLSILRIVSEKAENQPIALHAIVPYAYEYVRWMTRFGTLGLGRKLARQVLMSGNMRAIATGFLGIICMDPAALMETYLRYEISRIMSSVGKRQKLNSILLHEVITDMVVALDLDWFVDLYVRFVSKLGIKPGFETRNFAYLISKFREWNVDLSGIELVSSFNKVGFQMNPSKAKCEKALAEVPECTVIGMSMLAAGYLGLSDAAEYIKSLPTLFGVVVGISKQQQASETFSYLRKEFTH